MNTTRKLARDLWPATAAELDASEALHNSTTPALLRAAYALTHRIHESAHDRSDEDLNDLRAQRDLIDAEIERRCAR